MHSKLNFCRVKETIKINKMKRPPTEREKVFAENIPPVYKELVQFNSKISKQPDLKMHRALE